MIVFNCFGLGYGLKDWKKLGSYFLSVRISEIILIRT